LEPNAIDIETLDESTSADGLLRVSRTALIVGAILALALAWRLIGIQTTEVWRDEAVSLIHIYASWSDLCVRLPFVEDSPPLYFLLMKAWSAIFTSECGMRLQAVLIGVATVAALMKVAWLIHPRSFWAVGLLAAFSHIPVHYSQELRVYSFMTLIVVLGFLSAEHIIREPQRKRWLFLMGLFGAMAAHCHAVGIFVYPMTWIYLLIRLPRSQYRALWSPWNLGICIVGCLPMIWFNIHWAIQHKASGWWVDPLSTYSTLGLLNRFLGVEVGLLWIEETLPITVVKPLSILAGVAIYGSYIGLIVLALMRLKTRRPAFALLSSGMFFILMLVLTGLMGVPNVIERTLLPAWLPLLLLCGIGAVAENDEPKRSLLAIVATLVITLSCAASWVWYASFSDEERRPSFAKSFRWLDEQVRPNDMIVVTPSWAEDSTVYYLREHIVGEQLFTTSPAVYVGQPPRHTLASYRLTVTQDRAKEGPWSDRIRSAIKDRTGQDYSVWLICGYWQDLCNDPILEQLESFFADFECCDHYTPEKLAGLKVKRFVPKGEHAMAANERQSGGVGEGETK